MADFTKVTNESWFSRLGSAFKGIVAGLILIVVSFVLLFWNEGRAVKRQKALEEGGNKVVAVEAAKVDSGKEGQLVHLSGRAETEEVLADPVFGVGATALKLERNVEVFQWQESVRSEQKKKLGGGMETKKTYSYSREWSDRLIDSSKFEVQEGHANPKSLIYASEQWQAKKVKLGAFLMSPSLVSKINVLSPLTVGDGAMLPENLKATVKVAGAGFYVGASPENPEVGDTSVSFKSVNPLDVSVVSQQKGNSFIPYQAANGRKVELLQVGTHSAEEMFQKALDDNQSFTWMLRVGGFILMVIGFNMIFKLASVLADVIPVVGNIIGVGTGIIAFLLSAALSLATIAIAWIFYRPLLGAALLIVAVILIVWVARKLGGDEKDSVANAQ